MNMNIGNLSFMIVDDNDHMRKIMKTILRILGCVRVVEARDGMEALKLVRDITPDILITDWVMEPLDGLELTHLLRDGSDSPNPYIPIIMMSAYSELARVMTARDAGVTEFLVKPISAKGLFSRIQAIIEKPRPFVRTKTFFGPDRRRRDGSRYSGSDRRGGPLTRESVLPQAEIDKIFNPDTVPVEAPTRPS